MSSKKYRLGDISLQGIWVRPLLCSQTTVLSDLMDLFTAVLIPDDIVRIGEAGAKGAKQNFACVFAPACIGRFGRWSCARSLQIRWHRLDLTFLLGIRFTREVDLIACAMYYIPIPRMTKPTTHFILLTCKSPDVLHTTLRS
jgi:hypothetical protein